MRGPVNLLRLIRTGATFERSGAMGIALDAFSASARVRMAAGSGQAAGCGGPAGAHPRSVVEVV